MSSKNPQGDPEVKVRLCQNIIRERINFNSYKFDGSQTIYSHVNALKVLASACEFGDQSESRIVERVLSEYPDIFETLVQEENITLERLLDTIKLKENIKSAENSGDYEGGRDIGAQMKMLTKDDVHTAVNSSLKDKKLLTLNEVEILLQQQFHCSISLDDRTYIEEIYAEKLIELWLDEASEIVMNRVDSTLEHIEELTAIQKLQDCFRFGDSLSLHWLPYNSLLSELCKHSNYVKIQEKKSILKFKLTFLAFLQLKSSYLQGELNFCRSLIKTMKHSKHISELCDSLNMTNFVETPEDDTISFRKLLKDIMNSYVLQDCNNLKMASQAIVGQDRYYYIRCVKDTITAYLKPVVMTNKLLDGRQLLEVKGEHIVIGQVLEDIERSPEFNCTEEIRLVNAGVIHIDKDFLSEFWHGKNIVVFAETIIVSSEKTIIWDVSGQDAKSEERKQAGTNDEGIGLDGAEGMSGESGGNVMLICEEIENATFLKIVSNGGRGGQGQAGGNGRDGKDGDYMNEIEFKKNFPPASKWLSNSKRDKLETTRLHVMDNLQSVKIFVLGNLIPASTNDFNQMLADSINDLNDIYFETRTKSGCQILFSFYSAKMKFGFCQSFLMHKGSYGEPGKDAGNGGFGGKGGFPGEVKVVLSETSKSIERGIVIVANKGEDGKNGESGLVGKPGQSGIDCAYIDSTKPKIPFINKVQFPKYFVTDLFDSRRLKVEYHSVEGPERIYSPHKGQFAEITSFKKEIHHSCRQQNASCVKELTGSQFKVQVNRKKTICLETIMEQYEHKTSMIGNKKLEGIEKDIKHIYDELSNEEMLQKEQVVKETRITRQIEFSKLGMATEEEVDMQPSAEFLHGDLSNEFASSSVADVSNMNLNTSKLDLEELRSFWSSHNIQDIYQSKDKTYKEALLLFSSKYQLAVLNDLEQTFDLLNVFSLKADNDFTTPKVVGSVESTLTISNQQENFSEVENYLCNDSVDKRLSIIRKLEESATDGQFFMNIFNLYLDDQEFDDCEKFLSDKLLGVYKKHYNWFRSTKAKVMHAKLLLVLNCIMGNTDLLNKLVQALTEQNIHLKIDVEKQIRENPLLNILYKKYIEEVNKPFVWKTVFMSQEKLTTKLVEGFKNAIHTKGPLSVFFREVVAGLFRTNIMLYTISEHNKEMVLVHNHNPSADEVVHILIKDNNCLKLKTDEGLSKIIKAHEGKAKVCQQIQLHVELIKGQENYKEEFDKFISEGPYLHKDYTGICKSSIIKLKICHMLKEAEYAQDIASSFEVDKDQKLICSRLQVLKHEYVGYQSFLYHISLHMKTEGCKLTVKEFCCILNFILKSIVESSAKTSIVSWIIASHHQTDWIVEFLIFKLELYLKIPLENIVKNTWRKYLSQTNKDTCILLFDKIDCDGSLLKIEDAEEVLKLISQVPNYLVNLSRLCLNEWKYYLKDIFWANQMRNTGSWSEEELKIASFHLTTMENSFGKELCCKFIEVVKTHSTSIESEYDKQKVLNTLERLVSKEIYFLDKVLEHLSQAEVAEWENVVVKECFASKERGLDKLKDLIKKSSNTTRLLKSNIDETVHNVEKVNFILKFLKGKLKEESDMKKWIFKLFSIFEGNTVPLFDKAKLLQTKLTISDEMALDLEEVQKFLKEANHDNNFLIQTPSDFLQCNIDEIFLATICALIFIMCEKTLRNTQLLALLIFLKTSENVLGQVSTGEGKSFIIIAVAIMKALTGSKVDIITSSHVLATRDADKHKRLCQMFNLEVGHNCSENIEERKSIYSKCHIVYGELSHFQRDFLLDRAYNNNILGDRTFETIILDEVDSMLLDKANNVLYLSHDIPGLDKLEPLFVFIWKCLNEPSNANKLLDVDEVKERIINEMFGTIKVEDIRNLDLSLEGSAFKTWALLNKEGLIDSSGKVLYDQFDELKIDKVVKNCIHGDGIKYLLRNILNREKEFEIPNYLKYFAVDHLDRWIDSAINAMNLQNNVDYVVDVDRSENSCDRTPNIIIVDRDTGTDLTNSQWEQGLHQFLQLKHGCRLSPLTFKAVFVSNVTYLKMYQTLYGLTGTLGSESDRDLLKKVYKVEFVTIPTAKPKRFFEESPVLSNNTEDWSTKIVKSVYEITKTRSALIICNSLSDVFTLKKGFEHFSSKENLPVRQIQTYTRDYEKFNVERLEIGKVIISTNLAGRGTDIQLSQKLIENGGLHVCLSFLPNNSRIEEQAFGRSARSGQPGSGQLIFKGYGQNNISKVIDLKKERDLNEIFRISDVNKDYENKIKPEEELFSTFLEQYGSLRESQHSQEIKAILQMSCLDLWAFWLENNSCTGQPMSAIENLKERISKLSEEDVDAWINGIQDPFQLTKLGLLYTKKNNDKAIKLFDYVITSEPEFSEAAYYYRACALASKDDLSKDSVQNLVDELKIVEKKLKKRIECALRSGLFIDYLKNYNKRTILQIDSFKHQQQNVSKTYEVFMGSIHSIIGQPVNLEVFKNLRSKYQREIDEELTSSIIFNDFVEMGLIQLKIKDNLTERDLNFATKYGICPKVIKNILLSTDVGDGLDIEKRVLEKLKESALFPSREMFWKELVSVGVLENQETYVLVNHNKLKKIDPSSADKLKGLAIDLNLSMRNKVSLYMPEELGFLEEQLGDCYSFISKNEIKTVLGQKKFKFFKRENVIFVNKVASFTNLMRTAPLSHFDSIAEEDLIKIGISKATASCIIDNLIQEKVIDVKENCEPTQYKLLVNFEGIDKVELKFHKAYTDGVKSLLSHFFSFRLAFQILQHEVPHCCGNYSNLRIQLCSNLHQSFWFDLLTHGVIEHKINLKILNSGKLQAMFSMSMHKESYERLFSNMYGKEESVKIINDLIAKGWLKKTVFPYDVKLDKEVLKTLLPGSGPTYLISHKYEKNNDVLELEKPKELSDSLKCESQTIQLILLCNLNLCKKVDQIEDKLRNMAGRIHEIETPSFSLTPLEVVMSECRLPLGEIRLFNINGFDQVISLEEKKFTRRMMIGVFCVTMIALVEISVGVAFQLMYLPIGCSVLVQGIDDIIFVTDCVLSGLFSWRWYLWHKIPSLITTGFSCYAAHRFNFASKSAGGVLSKIKSSVSYLFSPQASSQILENRMFTQILKRVVVHIGEGIAYRATFGAVDCAINSQLETLAESIFYLVFKDIEKTITEHPCFQSAIKLHRQLGEKMARNIIEVNLNNISHSYEVKLQKTFESIDLKQIYTLIERTVSKSFNNDSSGIDKIIKILNAFHNVSQVVSSAILHLRVVSNLVCDILSDMQRELHIELKKSRRVNIESQAVDQTEIVQIKHEVLTVIQQNLKMVFSEHITKNLITPVVHAVGSCVETFSVKMISQTRNFLTDKEISHSRLNKPETIKTKSKVKKKMNKPGFFSFEFDEITREVLKTRKNKNVLSYLVLKNAPMDVYCLELCCKAITLASKQEGVTIPPLRVEIENNGVKNIFDVGDVRPNTPILHLSRDSDLLSNVKNNQTLITGLFKLLCEGLLQHYPELKDITESLLQDIVVNIIDQFCHTQSYESTADNKNDVSGFGSVSVDPVSYTFSQINTECEEKNPYQHFTSGSGWVFSPRVDVDLRGKDKTSNLSNIQKHVSKGFETALVKVNTHIHRIQSCLKSFNLVLGDFEATKHQIAPPPHDYSEIFHCYTVQYELVVPVILKGAKKPVDFNIVLCLQNLKPKKIRRTKSPLGPYILYEINPTSTKYLDKGLKGHILLNIDCIVASYSKEDCLVAGELIVPSKLQPPVKEILSILQVPVKPGPSALQVSAKPEPSALQAPVKPGPSALQAPVKPGPSALQAPVKPGPSALQVSAKPEPSALHVPDKPGPSALQAPVKPGTSALQAPVKPGPSILQAPVKPGPSALHALVKPGPSALQAPVKPGPSALQAPVKPGPSALQAPVKPGTSALQAPVKPGPSALQAPVIPGPSALQAPVKPGPSALQAPVKPGTSALQAPVKLGPSALQAPVKPGTSALQASVKPGPSALQAPVKPGPSALQVPVKPGPSALQASVKPGPSTLQAPAKPGPSALQAPVKPRPSALQIPAKQGPSASHVLVTTETEIQTPKEVGRNAFLSETEQTKPIHEECNAVIVGDSLFKYIVDYISLPKCHFAICPHMKVNQLKKKIIPLLVPGIKCVVLFFGNDIVKTNISEQDLASGIFDVIRTFQEHDRNVKIIMCTLAIAKQPADKHNRKIINVNRILEEYCPMYCEYQHLHVVNVDTNRIICPQDLGKDGFHLNRSGYHKMGRHISEMCKDIINMMRL